MTGGTYGEDVCGAEDADDDAGGDDQTPESGPEGTLGCGLFVQVAEDGDADDDHDDAEGNEPVARREEGPVFGGVALEKGDFGEYEEDCSFPVSYWLGDGVWGMEMEGLTAHTACD